MFLNNLFYYSYILHTTRYFEKTHFNSFIGHTKKKKNYKKILRHKKIIDGDNVVKKKKP